MFLVTVGGSSAAFVWFMNQQQARAGARLRAAAATALAEAGVHRAMAILESADPDGAGPGRRWRPSAYSETVATGSMPGRFTLSVADAPDGFVLVTSTGDVSGTTRRVRARVALASPALLNALYAMSVIRIEDAPAATIIGPYLLETRDRPWLHMAAGREIWFPAPPASINDGTGNIEWAPGPIDPPGAAGWPTWVARRRPVRLLLANAADLTVNQDHQRADIRLLPTLGIRIDGAVRRTDAFPEPPTVDRDYYRAGAGANVANARLNAAAGRYVGSGELERKRDSLYSATEFGQVRAYLRTSVQIPRMSGVIYVTGGVVFDEDERLDIADGTLVTEGSVHLRQGARLEIAHTAVTRAFPGLLVLDHGALIVGEEARLRVHGLILTSSVFDILRDARVDVVGSVLAGDHGLSFHNAAATVVIRYDPAVLGTPGLITAQDSRVVAWIGAWEELP
jgi:hypothetical protein